MKEPIEEVEVFKSNESVARKVCQALDEIDRILAEGGNPLGTGKVAYEAYYDFSNGKSLVSSQPLPTWDHQDAKICKAWAAVELAVVAELRVRER